MTDKQIEELNTLTFDFRPGPYTRVSPLIDGKNFLEEWDLRNRFVPLSDHELVEPILALDDIYYQCETMSFKCFYIGSCSCGYTGCSAVFCDIILEYGEMVWENFGTRESSLPHIGPFRFDWDQVVEDLRKARDDHRTTLT